MNALVAIVLALPGLIREDTGTAIDLQEAIDACREFADRADLPLGELRAGFEARPAEPGFPRLCVQFVAATFEYDDSANALLLAQNIAGTEERRNPNWAEGKGDPMDEAHSKSALTRLARALEPERAFRLRRSFYQSDDAPLGDRISAGQPLRFAAVSASFGPVGADGHPFFTLAGTFTIVMDARTSTLLEYRAYAPGEVTNSEDRVGEPAARRVAEATALEHYGALPDGSVMTLGYSEPRPDTPGATFRGRGGRPKEVRLAWRFMIKKFSYQGRFVDLTVDVDAGTGQVLWTNPRPRDPRLDK